MKKLFYLVFPLAVLILHSCASLTGFEDGRTNGEENHTVLVSLNGIQSPNFNDSNSDVSDNGTYPNIEAVWRYGFTEKLDLGLKANTFFNFAANVKYQVAGDRNSKYAMSLGTELGTFGFIGLWNVQLPIYTSMQLNEKTTLYVTPRYIAQFGSGSEFNTDGHINYFGGNTGLLFGRKHKFGVDIGYNYLRAGNDNGGSLLNFGVGGKFYFGPTAGR